MYLNQIEREKMKTEEIATKSVHEKSELDRTLMHFAEENRELQKQIHGVQSQLAEAEQQHAQR